MVILAVLSIVLAASALCFCLYLYTEVQKRVLSTAVMLLLKQSSEELSKDYGKQFRSIEIEWADMYQKFSRLVGRVDREKRDFVPSSHEAPAPPVLLKRSDLLRGRIKKNEQISND